jgi:hypothetical protein
MNINEIAINIPIGRSIDRAEIIKAARVVQPDFCEKSIYWLINQLIELGVIERVGRNKYFLIKDDKMRKDYTYQPSDKMIKVIEALANKYPLMVFQVWESIQFNYFLNHQIAHNTLFVEVERMLENSVYEFLRDKFHGNILLKPNREIYSLYGTDDTIVVLNLVTETPTDKNCNHGIMLEKLLVDMMTNKLIQMFVSKSEYAHIMEDAYSMYRIDETKMFHYARRRKAVEKIKKFINEQTKICLKTEVKDAR